jgi:putative endonuclease
MKEWFVYALRSLRDNNLYIGISQDPEKRVETHNKGKTESTKSRRPFILVYKERCGSLKEARERKILQIRIWERIIKKFDSPVAQPVVAGGC